MEMEAIYENIPDKNRNTVGPQTPSQNPTEAQISRRWFVVITVGLGLICVVLLIALILLYIHLTAERDQMKMTNMNKAKEYNETLSSLKINFSHLTDERDQLQKNLKSMSEMKSELETKVKNLNDALMKSTSGSSRYFISCEEKNWTDSRRFCMERGGDLVIISTEEEQKYISSVVNERAWIGLSDTEKEGNMKWVDKSPLNKGFWDKGEPNDYNRNEDCVEIIPTKPILSNWNDRVCTETKKWICEK